jgi:hypothetical protein
MDCRREAVRVGVREAVIAVGVREVFVVVEGVAEADH